MTSRKKDLASKYFPLMEKVFGYKHKMKLCELDLTKPWYQIFSFMTVPYGLTAISETITWIFLTYAPLLISQIISGEGSLTPLQFMGLFFILWLLAIISLYFYARGSSNLVTSFTNSAYKHFVLTDPKFHASRSTGEIISKISKGRTSIEYFFDIFVFMVLPIFVQVTVIGITFYGFNRPLGLTAFGMLLTIVTIDFAASIFANKIAVPMDIKFEDKMNEIGIEMLQSIFFLRGSFATKGQVQKLERANTRFAEVLATTWMIFINSHTPARLLYMASLGWLLVQLEQLVSGGKIEQVTAIAFAVMYFAAFSTVVNAGRQLEKLMANIAKVKDVFVYGKAFGKQSFPVLEDHAKIHKQASITVGAQNISYTYGHTKVFDGHNFDISVPHAQSSKLYGIIGPSGTGKTTLINILGGQLKPESGSVVINNLDIYKVGDRARQQLLAIQMQTSTSLRGSLKMNLLFGIKDKDRNLQQFSDQSLIKILEQVGLWKQVFKDKEGLETFIGEGGVTLSGGQRQRLNFASLYIRAKYYEPEVILIDEPTSSLDPISEKAITAMIQELAKEALTLVVAHRLKTLDEAVAIMDTSLLTESKELAFYTNPELVKASAYYQKLLSGEVELDS